MKDRRPRRALVLAGFLIALSPFPLRASVDTVELDPASGVFARRLPFDVPFVVLGLAPPGTTRVEGRYAERGGGEKEFPPTLKPVTALVSGVDGEGRFRLQMGPVGPGRAFQFHLVFERRLSTGAGPGLRNEVRDVLRRELGGVDRAELTRERAAAVRAALTDAYERALNLGQALVAARGSISVLAPGSLLDSEADPEAVRVELLRLATDQLTSQASSRRAVKLQEDTAPALRETLVALNASPALRRLLQALEARPELDPRNPRSSVFMPTEARLLVEADPAGLGAVAEGRNPDEAGAALRDAQRPDEAGLVRERYHRTARALEELSDWLGRLLTPGRDLAPFLDALALDPADLGTLLAFGRPDQGALRRARWWADSLEGYALDAERALGERDRALDRASDEIVAQALAAMLRQTTLTEAVSSQGGLYVSMDLGVLYPFTLERAAVYVGVNVYLRPVNKDAPLSRASPGQRLALTLGLTLTDTKLDEDTRYENLLGQRSNIVVGAGIRVTRSLRIGAGALLFLKNDPDPLVTDRSLAATAYVSASFDVDLGALFRKAAQ